MIMAPGVPSALAGRAGLSKTSPNFPERNAEGSFMQLGFPPPPVFEDAPFPCPRSKSRKGSFLAAACALADHVYGLPKKCRP